MPNITLESLRGIQGVTQSEMTQPSETDQCGAYATIAAVGAHGCFPMNAQLAYQVDSFKTINNASKIECSYTYHQLSSAVYQITGILNKPANRYGPVRPELKPHGKGYNSPAAMAKVAIDMGRPAVKINVQAASFSILGNLYPGERTRCEAVVGANNFNADAEHYSTPKDTETHILCVQSGNEWHWVAQGSDGNFYDPIDGSLSNTWMSPANGGDEIGSYTFAGLWLVIS